jgi:response regulator of citrate/malate metabolism
MGMSDGDIGRRGMHNPYTLDEVRAVFGARRDIAEPLTAAEIGEAAGRSLSASRKKAKELVKRGELATKKVGARGRVYWMPVDGGDISER